MTTNSIPVSLVFAVIAALPMAFCVDAVVHLGLLGAGPFGFGALLLCLAVVYMLIGRFVVRVFTSRHIRYVVTNRRVMIMEGSAGRRMTSAYLSSLPYPFLTEAPDGSGSIMFGPPPPIWIRGARGIGLRSFASETSTLPVLWYIADARRVLDLIVAAQRPELPPVYSPSDAPTIERGAGVTNVTRPSSVKPGGVLQQLAFLISLAGLGLVGLGTITLVQQGLDVTNATVTSCTEAPLPQSTTMRVACEVTWSDDTGRHVATYTDLGIAMLTPGTTIPLRIRGDVVWSAEPIRSAERRLVIGLALLGVAVALSVIRARRARHTGAAPPGATGGAVITA